MGASQAPELDEALLDELARIYMRATLDELMRELCCDAPAEAALATPEERI